MHQVEALVDLLERQRVGDHRVDLDLAVHVPVDDLRHVGAAARAAEGGALPDRPVTSWNGRVAISLPASATPMMIADAPAAVAAFQRLAHHVGVAGAVEGVVGAAVGQLDELRRRCRRGHALRVDEVGHAEACGPIPRLPGLMSTPMILSAPDQLRALDDVEADAAEAEHDDLGARLDLGGVDHRADAGGHAAADVADLVERRVLADLGHRDLGQHGEVREGRAAHVVEDRLALVARSGGAVGHHALALGGADRGAEVGLAGRGSDLHWRHSGV